MPVQLTNRQRRFPVNTDALADTAQACLDLLEVGHGSLSVLLVNDRAMRPINRDFRQIDRATDVLSFPMLDGTPEQILAALRMAQGSPFAEEIGDVVISVETARAQAAEHGIPIQVELTVLLVHGILHLLGYDHETGEADAAKMRAAEQALLDRLKLHHASLIARAKTG